MEISVSLMRQLDTVEPGLRQVLYAILEEIERQSKERVTKDDFRELRQIVGELAEAQKRTEARIEELAEAQKRTEARVEELAEAQKRTEKELQALARSHKQLQKQVGGLANAVGYGIEDRLMPFIPAFARKEFGIEILRVDRQNVEYDGGGGHDEVNILAVGRDEAGRPT